MTAKKKAGSGRIPIYKTYMFRDKDPVIDLMRTAFKASGISRRELAETAGVSQGCYKGWWDGVVARPQFATLEATAKALGKTFRLVDDVPVSKRR